jgi:hypothetical protein
MHARLRLRCASVSCAPGQYLIAQALRLAKVPCTPSSIALVQAAITIRPGYRISPLSQFFKDLTAVEPAIPWRLLSGGTGSKWPVHARSTRPELSWSLSAAHGRSSFCR